MDALSFATLGVALNLVAACYFTYVQSAKYALVVGFVLSMIVGMGFLCLSLFETKENLIVQALTVYVANLATAFSAAGIMMPLSRRRMETLKSKEAT